MVISFPKFLKNFEDFVNQFHEYVLQFPDHLHSYDILLYKEKMLGKKHFIKN